MVVPLSSIPQSREGFYAINNQFLTNGPKWFWEFKAFENGDMYVRMDLPGVPNDDVNVSLEPDKQGVSIVAVAPKEHKHDNSERKYLILTGLLCNCCEISGFTSNMSNGVLRLLLSKTNNTPLTSSCFPFFGGPDLRDDLRGKGPYTFSDGTNPDDPMLTGRVLHRHPAVLRGSDMAYESKQLQNGSLYVRLDMPGVPKENFTVSVGDGKVKVTGEAHASSHDSGCRFYSGDVAMLANPVDIPSRRIKTIAKNGVIRLIIPPV